MLAKGRALDIIQNSGPGEGLKHSGNWKRLTTPNWPSSLSLIHTTKFGPDIESELEMFDKNIRRYEAESGKTLDDEILLGVAIAGLQDHYDGSCDAEFKSVEQVPLGSW